MEETEVDLKVAHDPISMIQEIERYRKTGKRDKRSVNTKNILFIMSGAFNGLDEIIKKRVSAHAIGFGAHLTQFQDSSEILTLVASEDLINYGFESEFVGRLPVRTVFEKLTEQDLFEILKNPNNPIILGKKLDFAAYGIEIKFDDAVLKILAKTAYAENTGARGLVSAVEKALLPFEKKLPSTGIKKFPVTAWTIQQPDKSLTALIAAPTDQKVKDAYETLVMHERQYIKDYLKSNKTMMAEKYNLTMTPARIDTVAKYYAKHIMDVGKVIRKIKSYYDDVKKIELYFFKNHDINIVLEEDAIDFIIEKIVNEDVNLDTLYRQLSSNFEHGLKLVREKTGRNRFFVTRDALINPESYIGSLIRRELKTL
jgi:ATP-dependent Clp protease ATP-binding subunit ClpA